MANARSSPVRRRELRRSMPRTGPAWWAALRRREFLWSALYVGLFTLVGGTIILLLAREPRYFVQQALPESMVARVPFVHEDELKTLTARENAANEQPPVFRANESLLRNLREDLDNLPGLAGHERLDQVPVEVREDLNLTEAGLRALRDFFGIAQATEFRQDDYGRWSELTSRFLRDFFGVVILAAERYDAIAASGLRIIEIDHPLPDPARTRRQPKYRSEFYSVADRPRIETFVRTLAAERFGNELAPTITAIVMQQLEPSYRYDEQLTLEARRASADAVVPIRRNFQSGDLLVVAGQQLKASDVDLLGREWGAYEAALSLEYKALRAASLYGLVLLIGIGLWGYIWSYAYKVVRNPMRGFALVTLLLLMQLLAVSLTDWQPKILYSTAILPTLLATVVLTIVYDQRFALAVGAFHVALVMLSLSLPIDFAIVMLTGVGVSIALLSEVRTRSRVVVVGLWAGLAMGAATLLSAIATRNLLVDGELWRILTEDAVFAVITGLIVGLLVQGVLPAIEKLFKVTTAMTLKELNDASHPLLQRLAQEAPGTYQHSLRIADMAEAAAESIGGHGLLCRVGAMYHDIGKVNKPMYFIENQGGGPNRHSKLSPAMSLLIIVGHVKDGIEMAREAGLPPAIRHFIESHHGTTLVEYFFHAAKRQKEAADEDAPSEFEFRYPGPKPATKEAAILLLCDSIEAAARTLSDPTPIRIEQLVHNLAMKRLMDNQFDECNLTLSELHKIEQAITKTLNAIYHARIKYPGERQQPQPQAPTPAPAEPGPTPPAAAAS